MKNTITFTFALVCLVVLNAFSHNLAENKPSIINLKSGEKFTASTHFLGCFGGSSTKLVIEKKGQDYYATYQAWSFSHKEILAANKPKKPAKNLQKKLTQQDLEAIIAWEKALLQKKQPKDLKSIYPEARVTHSAHISIGTQFNLSLGGPLDGYGAVLIKIFGKKVNG